MDEVLALKARDEAREDGRNMTGRTVEAIVSQSIVSQPKRIWNYIVFVCVLDNV